MLTLPDRTGIVAVDTETSGLHPDDGATVSVVSLAWGGGSLVLPFDQGMTIDKELPRGYTPSLFDQDAPNLGEADWVQLLDWLEQRHIVAHNAKFDLLMLNTGTRKWEGRDLTNRLLGDTAVAASLLWPTQSVALKKIAARLWGEQERDEEKAIASWMKGKREKRYDLVPWDLMADYALADAVLCYRLWEHTSELAHLGEIDPTVWRREMELTRVLTKMEIRGIGFDAASSMHAANLIEIEQEEAAKAVPFRPINPNGARRWFFEENKIPPYSVTATGKISINAEVIRKLEHDGWPGASEYARWNQLGKARSMWYASWSEMTGEDGRLRPVYHQTKTDEGRGTITGRLSVQRVQLQAVPHNYRLGWLPDTVPLVRTLFRPKAGFGLFELDMSQAEIRVAAGVAQCGSLIDAFERGEDAHDATCRLVFNIEKENPNWDQYRSIAKRIMFGILYGAGVNKIRAEIAKETNQNVTDEIVRGWLRDYRHAMPEVMQTAKRLEREAEKNHKLTLATGRVRWFAPDEHLYKAFNAVIQGNVAEAMKNVMLQVESDWPGAMVLQIHDSIVVELEDETQVEPIARTMEREFSTLFGVQFRADHKRWS